MKEKITIHRALAELKLIDSKITKKTSDIAPVTLMQDNKLINNPFNKDEFEKKAKNSLQSVQDLIRRKHEIKSAIVKANSQTPVTIGSDKMTIAEAINFKAVIDLKKELIKTLSYKYNTILATFNTENEKVKKVALDNAKIMLGKQGDDNIKPTDDDVKAITDPFLKRNEIHLVDPLDIVNLIERLEEEVYEFETEVDAVLSEVNATTFIEL